MKVPLCEPPLNEFSHGSPSASSPVMVAVLVERWRDSPTAIYLVRCCSPSCCACWSPDTTMYSPIRQTPAARFRRPLRASSTPTTEVRSDGLRFGGERQQPISAPRYATTLFQANNDFPTRVPGSDRGTTIIGADAIRRSKDVHQSAGKKANSTTERQSIGQLLVYPPGAAIRASTPPGPE